MQVLAVVFIIHCEITLHVSGALCTHHQEYIKTVDVSQVQIIYRCGVGSVQIKGVQSRGVYFTMSRPNLAVT